MARGITESDVHNAADALVSQGERPTVERIRTFLGTGSPNTVTRCLETWWQALGKRLEAHKLHLDVPDAPTAVTVLAGQWWELSLKGARQGLEASKVERELEAQRTGAEALEAQFGKLKGLSEAVEAAIRRAELPAVAAPKKRKVAAVKAKKRPKAQ